MGELGYKLGAPIRPYWLRKPVQRRVLEMVAGVCNAPNTLALVLPYRFELIREFAACTPTAPAFEASQSWGSTLVGLRPTARRKSMWVGGEKFTVRGVKFHGFHRRGIWFVGGPPLLGCAKHSDVPHQVFIPFQFG